MPLGAKDANFGGDFMVLVEFPEGGRRGMGRISKAGKSISALLVVVLFFTTFIYCPAKASAATASTGTVNTVRTNLREQATTTSAVLTTMPRVLRLPCTAAQAGVGTR